MSGYPDSHLARRNGSGPHRKRKLIALIPVAVLAGWFLYLWLVSGVLVSVEKYPNGDIKAEGFVKRLGLTGEYRRHGKWRTFYPDGRPSGEGSYLEGLKQSDWIYWDQDGHPAGTAPSLTSTAPHVGEND